MTPKLLDEHDAYEQVKRIAHEATEQLNVLLDVVRGFRAPAAAAARCADGIRQMQTDLARIEAEFQIVR